MLKETKAEETLVFFVTFLSLVAFQLGGAGPPGPPSGYAYAPLDISTFNIQWLASPLANIIGTTLVLRVSWFLLGHFANHSCKQAD